MKYEVIVQLKPEVLDPEGRAIRKSLDRLGFNSLRDVQVSKRYVLELDEQDKNPDATAHKIAEEYLANVVAESFTVEKI
ncbi:MAG: phosphoribosylformylglycinamidine synthase subunit PurS [Bdellovibrionota bacterium]